MKILIADDSASIRKRLNAIIEKIAKGSEIIHAQNVQEAIEKALAFEPDLTILDIRMPGGSGIDVLKELKARRPGATVIMLTNYPYPQYKEKCIKEGATFFFDKSTEFERVIKVVKEVVQ